MNRRSASTLRPAAIDEDEHRARFAVAVHAGLSQPRKHLPTAFLYDERGSALFEQICDLPEYYLTRTELSIMREHVGEMAAPLGAGATVIEYGSGSSIKTRLLLDAMTRPHAYIPVDISREHLEAACDRLRAEYPALRIVPTCADFTGPFELPERIDGPRVAYFPGSTIGNFDGPAATELMRHMAKLVGAGGSVLIGADLRKSAAILEPAYDDAAGVTAEFNLNLLVRIDRELGGDLDPSRFRHRAYYDADQGRIVMTLVSTCAQLVNVANRRYTFAEDEVIITEYSHKYSREGFAALAAAAGLDVAQVWTDESEWFSVQRLVPRC